ncbi:MAG: leucine-rich repeat domain-containing protein [Treponema sp.]|nr:leucine-rich repeat domain-containing protein [Treponema sp.]
MEEYENQKTVSVHGCKDYASFWRQMSELPDVEKINLYFGTMPDCHDFCRLPKLRELRMCYLKKLSDLHGIEVLGDTLKSLWFETGAGKNIKDWSPLSALTELEELVIGNNSVIADLHFLEPMKKLNNLRIVGVKITAEDLNPLRGIEQVVFYRTGIDRKLDAFLSSSQRSFRTAVFERLDEIKKDLQEQYNQAQ